MNRQLLPCSNRPGRDQISDELDRCRRYGCDLRLADTEGQDQAAQRAAYRVVAIAAVPIAATMSLRRWC